MIEIVPVTDNTESEITIPVRATANRIAWLDEKVKGFAEMRAVAERVRLEADESRRKYPNRAA